MYFIIILRDIYSKEWEQNCFKIHGFFCSPSFWESSGLGNIMTPLPSESNKNFLNIESNAPGKRLKYVGSLGF